MMKFLMGILCFLTFSNFAYSTVYEELPDHLLLTNFQNINSPIYLVLNDTISFPEFVDRRLVYIDPTNSNKDIWLYSKNGPKDHVQNFIPHKLRVVTDADYYSISTGTLTLDFFGPNFEHLTYGEFKSLTNNIYTFHYEEVAPIEYFH